MDWLTASQRFTKITETYTMKDSRTKKRSKKTNAATFFYCAFTLPALTIGASAHADDAVLEPASDTTKTQTLAQTFSSPTQQSQATPASQTSQANTYGKRRA